MTDEDLEVEREVSIRRWSKSELKVVIYETVYMIYYYMSDVDDRCTAFLDKWLPIVFRDVDPEKWQHLEKIRPGIDLPKLHVELEKDGEIFRKVGTEMGLDQETIDLFKEMQELMKVITLRPTSTTG